MTPLWSSIVSQSSTLQEAITITNALKASSEASVLSKLSELGSATQFQETYKSTIAELEHSKSTAREIIHKSYFDGVWWDFSSLARAETTPKSSSKHTSISRTTSGTVEKEFVLSSSFDEAYRTSKGFWSRLPTEIDAKATAKPTSKTPGIPENHPSTIDKVADLNSLREEGCEANKGFWYKVYETFARWIYGPHPERVGPQARTRSTTASAAELKDDISSSIADAIKLTPISSGIRSSELSKSSKSSRSSESNKPLTIPEVIDSILASEEPRKFSPTSGVTEPSKSTTSKVSSEASQFNKPSKVFKVTDSFAMVDICANTPFGQESACVTQDTVSITGSPFQNVQYLGSSVQSTRAHIGLTFVVVGFQALLYL